MNTRQFTLLIGMSLFGALAGGMRAQEQQQQNKKHTRYTMDKASGSTISNCLAFPHAVLWQDGTVIDLGHLGGTNSSFEVAFGINNHGQVVGRSDLPGDTTFHAFLWQNGRMSDLGTLPGYFSSEGASINDNGQVVGQSCTMDFGTCSAILLEHGVMTDLNSLIPSNFPLYLLEGLDINSRGQIVGLAFQQSTGEVHAFLANPCDQRRNDQKDCEDGAEGATAAESASERPKITLPENVRNLLRKQRAGRPALISPNQ